MESHAFEAAVLSKSEGDAQAVVRVVRNFKDVYIEGRIPLKLTVYVVCVFALWSAPFVCPFHCALYSFLAQAIVALAKTQDVFTATFQEAQTNLARTRYKQ